MKSSIACLVIAVASSQYYADAFTPTAFRRPAVLSAPSSSSLKMADPSSFVDVFSNVDSHAIFSSFTSLADELGDVVQSASDAVVTTAPDVVTSTADQAVAAVADPAAAAVAADSGNGWFGFLAGPIEGVLEIIHSVLVGVGVSSNAWGISILMITVLVKLLTFPLTKAQMESTMKMQALQPAIKELQAKYASNPEVMNQKISEFYQSNEVNPLAGCLPSLVQLPVFIGLYRGVLNLAKEDKLNEPFLWLPNLEGPTYGADPSHASEWITKGWVDGIPSLGWDQTAAFLTLPAILIVSQFASMAITSPKVEGQEQPGFIKFLPFLIGYFSLNVPAALGIYWVANNFITTALTVIIKSGVDTTPVTSAGAGSNTGVIMDTTPTQFTPAPMREKPDGFGASSWEDDAGDAVTPITPMDAEVVAQDFAGEGGQKQKKQRGKKKKKKRN